MLACFFFFLSAISFFTTPGICGVEPAFSWTTGMFSRISAGLAGCLFWTTSCPVNANFVVEVDGTPTACTFEQQTNSYNTHTATTTDPSLWIPNTFDGKYPTNYDLKYDRDDSSHARVCCSIFVCISSASYPALSLYGELRVSCFAPGNPHCAL